MKKAIYTVAALLVAPLLPALVLALWSALVNGLVAPTPSGILGIGLLYYSFSFIFALLIAFPIYLIAFFVYGVVEWWLSTFSGVLVGAIVVLLISLPLSVEKITQNILPVVVYAFIGGCTGLLFWCVLWLGGAHIRVRAVYALRLDTKHPVFSIALHRIDHDVALV